MDFKVKLYILVVDVCHEYGTGLKRVLENKVGDFIFNEPDVPHEVFNMSDTELMVVVVACSDASESGNIIDYDRNSEA